MTYEQALQYVNSLSRFGIEPGLSRVKKLLNILGNPQNDLKFIHVAGTNGKGSTCAYISSILSCSGFKTGLFISPFIIDFRERMQINKQMIPKKDLVELINYIIPFVNNMADNGEFITEFELITAIAFLWFKKEKCDIVVLEVGLGGRLDATNVINNALVSVITSISFDHINILGSTIKEIAGEKAGILKPKGTLVLYPHQSAETFDVIKTKVKKLENKLVVPDINKIKVVSTSLLGTNFVYDNQSFYIKLLGDYQVNNAVTAITVINELIKLGYYISFDDLKLGLSQTDFPSRFEVISKKPLVILDGTHNKGGAIALSNTISQYLNGMKIKAIVGMLKDKDVNAVINILGKHVSSFILTQPDNTRAMSKYDLQKIVMKVCSDCIVAEDDIDAVKLSFEHVDENTAIIVFGSLYLSSQLRPIIKRYYN